MTKQKEKKPIYKRTWFIILMSVLALGIIFGDSDDEDVVAPEPEEEVKSDEEQEEQEKVVEEELEEQEKVVEEVVETEEEVDVATEEAPPADEVTEDAEENDPESQAILEELALQVVRDSFGEGYEITLNDDTFEYLPLDADIGYAAVMVKEGQMSRDEWNYLLDSFKEMSLSYTDLLGEGYLHAIVNPMNTENYLVLIMDGAVLYDATAD